MEDELYLSLKEDLMDELIDKYYTSIETANEILQLNKLKERFMRDENQFDHIEVEEIAEEFYKTYKHRKKLIKETYDKCVEQYGSVLEELGRN